MTQLNHMHKLHTEGGKMQNSSCEGMKKEDVLLLVSVRTQRKMLELYYPHLYVSPQVIVCACIRM